MLLNIIAFQVRAHSQTVGALVATKTELEARLTHLERAAETRIQEMQSLTASRNETRAKLQECEDALQLAKSSAAHSETAKTEALRQVGFQMVLVRYCWLI